MVQARSHLPQWGFTLFGISIIHEPSPDDHPTGFVTQFRLMRNRYPDDHPTGFVTQFRVCEFATYCETSSWSGFVRALECTLEGLNVHLYVVAMEANRSATIVIFIWLRSIWQIFAFFREALDITCNLTRIVQVNFTTYCTCNRHASFRTSRGKEMNQCA